MLENLRKAFQQVCAAFEPLSDVDGGSGDDDKGKNISDVCFMARGESDTEYEDNELKQPHDVLDCSTCNLNKLKLKDVLGRVEFMEDVVKNNEVLSCPKCRKSKCVMVDCENCANLEKEVSYLKNSLLRFSDGKKNFNMILDQSKVLMLEVALVARKENVWIVDSGCSRHMTGDKNWFSSLKKASKTESIIFGDASTSVVLATGLVKVNKKFELKNVALVEDLKYNLLSVSQIVDENFEVHFKKTGSKVFDSCGDSVLNISRYGRVFKADFENPVSPVITCLVAKFDKYVMFWHRRHGHVGFDHLTRLSGLDLVPGLPKLKKDLDLVCKPCRHAKMVASSHTPIVSVMMDAPGQLLHMDIVGPARVQSVGGKWYMLIIIDDFSRYSWIFFMATKDEAFQHFRGLFLRLDLEFPGSLKRIRSDNGGTLSQVQGEDDCIFEDESNDNDNDKEEVYVKQPPGFENPDFPNHVYKLSKALYGLKQAPRAWYDRLKNFLLAKGFSMGKVDKTLFVLKHADNQLFVQIYVDDIIFGCSTHALVVDFVETMHREFEMSMMGELLYFLGLQIKQTPQGIFVHQTKYTKDILRRFKMENYKPISTPIGSTAVLDPDEDGEAVDQQEYRSMIGSLLYLTASRPDIQFVVCLCARFQASPRASHRQAVKRIMWYLNHTLEFGIWYSTSCSICLSGYSDADFGGCRIDRKSTSGTCHFLGTSLIAWSSRKQSSVAQSTAESEYVAAASCCSQILWLLSTLKDYGLTFDKVPLFCDNTSVINIAKNHVQLSRTKHIDIHFHFLRDHVEKGDVELQFLDTKLQIADIFTKPLDSNRFAFLCGELGIIHPFGMV
uniref:Retrotransposon protein, putative, unclassified n=1 Tax=Oryza sativa subsp. japonica TaxID=39947 RepID=Q2QXM1_ORYSJ|nr:retrotransposon protein, putative, unclassified [Oryza sativa Japonica Group]